MLTLISVSEHGELRGRKQRFRRRRKRKRFFRRHGRRRKMRNRRRKLWRQRRRRIKKLRRVKELLNRNRRQRNDKIAVRGDIPADLMFNLTTSISTFEIIFTEPSSSTEASTIKPTESSSSTQTPTIKATESFISMDTSTLKPFSEEEPVDSTTETLIATTEHSSQQKNNSETIHKKKIETLIHRDRRQLEFGGGGIIQVRTRLHYSYLHNIILNYQVIIYEFKPSLTNWLILDTLLKIIIYKA